jgi:ADP-dependent NAD(P)H-hydrate dehydratase
MSKTGSSPSERVHDLPLLPERDPATHKGLAGRVAIVAGSRGMSGAAILAGLGALRGGSGLVRICCADEVLPIIAGAEPCYMTTPVDVTSEASLKAAVADWATVVAVGPGLGEAGQDPAVLERIAAVRFGGPLVIDADALTGLAEAGRDAVGLYERLRAGAPPVLTPHPGEMARLRAGAGLPKLAGNDDETRVRIAHEYAVLSGAIVVLKGHRTVVATAERVYVNETGNAGMATGGMGDVLTGLIAALVGQGLAPFDAARLAVHAHGLAGDFCAREIGPVGFLARDVADALPAALSQLSRRRLGFR